MRIGQAGLAVLLILLAFALSSCGFLQGLFNKPPVAVIEASPTNGFAPLEVTFDGSGSYDPDGRVVAFYWDFGDAQTHWVAIRAALDGPILGKRIRAMVRLTGDEWGQRMWMSGVEILN